MGSRTTALCGLAVLAGMFVVASGTLPGIEAAPGTDRMSVEMPEPRVIDRSGGEPTTVTGSVVEQPGPVTCQPQGCELWRADVGSGRVLDVGGVLVHAGTTALSGISIVDGAILWSSPYEDGAQPGRLLAAEGEPLLVVVDAGDGLEARSPEDGSVAWTASLPGRPDVVELRGETLLVSGQSGETGDVARGPSRASTGFVANIDRATGEPRWIRTDLGVLSIEPEMPLVRFLADVVGGLDPATGETVWRLALSPMGSGPSEFAHGGGRVVIANGGGLTIVDGRTGEVERQVAVSVAPEGWIHVTESVAMVTSPEHPGEPGTPMRLQQDSPATVTVVNLIDPEGEIRSFDGVIDIHWLANGLVGGPAGDAPGRHRSERASEGLVLGALDPGAFVMHRLNPAGEPVWRRHVLRQPGRGELDVACCWSLEPGTDAGSFLAVPPAGGTDPVRVIAVDGRILTSFDRPSAQDRADHSRWPKRGAITLPGTTATDPTIVAGPWASAEVSGPTEPVATDPVVLVTETGLLAIDPDFLGGR